MFINKFDSTKRDATHGPMNRGATFLVAPQNLTFNKRAIRANEQNHVKVMDSIQGIISKYDEKEAKRLRGLSLESEDRKRAVKKPPNIERTEALMNQIKQNKGGH